MKREQQKKYWIFILLLICFISGYAQNRNINSEQRDSIAEEMVKIMLGQINIFGDYNSFDGWDTIPYLRGYETDEFLKYYSSKLMGAKNDAIDPNDLEIDGLVTDATRTKMGRDFYDLFYQQFIAPPGAKNYAVVISERPYRATTTQVQIFVNDELVFEQFLQPRYEVLENLSAYAVETVQGFLMNYEEIMHEMNGEDMKGSGIY